MPYPDYLKFMAACRADDPNGLHSNSYYQRLYQLVVLEYEIRNSETIEDLKYRMGEMLDLMRDCVTSQV